MATALIGAGAGLLSSVIGGILGNKPQTTTTDSTGNSTTNQNQQQYGTTSLTHNWDTASTNLKNQLVNLYSQNISAPLDASGVINQGIQGNNQAANASMLATNQSLAARGLGTSPIAGNAIIANQGQRAGMNANTINSAPAVLQSLFNSRMSGAGGFFNSLAQDTTQQTAQSQTGYSSTDTTGHSTQTGTGNEAAGGFSSLGSGLAFMAGKGMFGKTPWQS